MTILNTVLAHWRSLLVALAGVILVLFASRGPEAMPGDDPACSDELAALDAGEILTERLEILSWNIQKASNQGWQEDLARFGEGVHLAFIQEAALEAPLVETIDSTEYRSFAEGYTTTNQSTGVMTLSSSAPSISCNYQSVEPWLGTPKATGVTYHKVAGLVYPLLAVNLHAVNFAMGVKEYRQQIHTIKTLLANHEGPIIVAGDLNTWSERRQQLVDEFMLSHGLEPVVFTPDLRTRVFGRALDHVYVRGLEAEQAEVIEVETSDHNALRMSLRFIHWEKH